MSSKRALLLIDHGSRRAEANLLLEELAKAAQKREPNLIVKIAHLEIAAPNIEEGFKACVAAGASHVTIVPCMLTLGRHVVEDIPRIIASAALETPHVTYKLSEPLGTHPTIVDIILDRFSADK